MVGHGVARGFVFQFHRGTKHHFAAGIDAGRVDDLGGRELALNFLNTAFNEALAVFGRVVLGVFAEVALGARFGNGVDHARTLDGFQSVQFLFQLFRAALGDGNGGHVLSLKKKPPGVASQRQFVFFSNYAVNWACSSCTE